MLRLKRSICASLSLLGLAVLQADVYAQTSPASEETVAIPTEWDTFYVVLLRENPDYDAGALSDSAQALSTRHIEYQLRLQESGRAIAGGGFGVQHNGIVGMTLLHASTVEEAQRIAGDDPAVEAGRFEALVLPWYVPANRLPE